MDFYTFKLFWFWSFIVTVNRLPKTNNNVHILSPQELMRTILVSIVMNNSGDVCSIPGYDNMKNTVLSA